VRTTALDVIILIGLLIATVVFFAGCGHAPLSKTADPQQCCERLHKRDVTLKEFERLCIALVFLEGRFKNDPKASQNVAKGMKICKYVYNVR